jgi:hypothetical protein
VFVAPALLIIGEPAPKGSRWLRSLSFVPISAEFDRLQDYLTDLQHSRVLMPHAIAARTDVHRGDKLLRAIEAMFCDNERILEQATAVLQRVRPNTDAGPAHLRLVPHRAGAGDAPGDARHLPSLLRTVRAGRQAAAGRRRVMSDEPFTTPGRKTPTRQPTPAERLFEFLRGHDRFLCELRDQGAYGTEAQFHRNEEFLFSRRFAARVLAIAWAEGERTAIVKGGR